MNNIWTIVLPIAVGGIIGYCTNYIAIKMLFRPRKEYRIGNWKVPFTPGIIPKNQPRIARAVGNAVGENLLTRDDLLEVLKGEKLKDTIAEEITKEVMDGEHTVRSVIQQVSPLEEEETTKKLNEAVVTKIVNGIERIDFPALILQTAGPLIMEKTRGSLMAMFINEDTIKSFAQPIGEGIQFYMKDHGYEILEPPVTEEMNQMLDQTLAAVVVSMGGDHERVKKAAGDLYMQVAEQKAADLLANLNIAELVEKKVNEMDVKDLEELVMSVMKQELQAVINLGAVIGAVIGTINIFF